MGKQNEDPMYALTLGTCEGVLLYTAEEIFAYH